MRKVICVFLLGVLVLPQAFAEEENIAKKAGHGIEKGGEAAGRGIEKGLDATGRGLKKGANATGHGVEKGVAATGRGLEKAGKWLEKEMHEDKK